VREGWADVGLIGQKGKQRSVEKVLIITNKFLDFIGHYCRRHDFLGHLPMKDEVPYKISFFFFIFFAFCHKG
jgi:hypothetical protein